MHNAAQAANSVYSLFLAEPIRREHGPANIHKLLRDGLQHLVTRIRCLQREGIAPRCFPGVSPVGIGERENGLRAGFANGRTKEAIKQLAWTEKGQVVFEPEQS